MVFHPLLILAHEALFGVPLALKCQLSSPQNLFNINIKALKFCNIQLSLNNL